MNITYLANKTFAQLHKSDARFLFARGPVGSGKSTGCVWHLFIHGCNQPVQADGTRRSRYVVVRASYPSLKSTTIKTWIDWFKDKITIVYDTPIKGTIKFELPDGTNLEMEILFLALESELDVKKLQSLEITGAHINEAAEVDESIFQMLKTRINRYPAGKDGGCRQPFILCDYNPPNTTHWLYKLAEELRPEKHAFFVQPPAVTKVKDKYVVNPDADNLDPKCVACLKSNKRPDCNACEYENFIGVRPEYYEDMCLGNDPDFINVFVMNNYGQVRSGRPVYKDYDDQYHCAKTAFQPLAGLPVIIGFDQGLTPAAVFTQLAPNGQVIVFDEITTEDCSLQEFCNDYLWPKIRNEYPQIIGNFTIICDPATRARSMNDSRAGTDIIKEAGLPFRTAKTNAATFRRESVTNFLRKKDGFLLSPACQVLREGFISQYKYEESRAAQSSGFKDTPAKNEFSHPHDALQYAVMEYYRPRRTLNKKFKRLPYKAASSVAGY